MGALLWIVVGVAALSVLVAPQTAGTWTPTPQLVDIDTWTGSKRASAQRWLESSTGKRWPVGNDHRYFIADLGMLPDGGITLRVEGEVLWEATYYAFDTNPELTTTVARLYRIVVVLSRVAGRWTIISANTKGQDVQLQDADGNDVQAPLKGYGPELKLFVAPSGELRLRWTLATQKDHFPGWARLPPAENKSDVTDPQWASFIEKASSEVEWTFTLQAPAPHRAK